MLFIVKATIHRTERGIESERERTDNVIHPVEALDATQACEILTAFYKSKSQPDDYYGDRYVVQDVEAFETLSKASLA